MEKLKKENAINYQQGGFRYQNEDASRIYFTEHLQDLNCFSFDVHIPIERRLEDFKANVINRGIKSQKSTAGQAFKNANREKFDKLKEK